MDVSCAVGCFAVPITENVISAAMTSAMSAASIGPCAPSR
jgi:hypothetical protein